MMNYLMPHKKSNNMAMAAGIAVVAGVALVAAIPQTRKICSKWIGNAFDGLKNRMANAKGSGSWEQDLARAEKLKGPVDKRRNTAKIDVPSAGTNAWKEDWSSE